MNARPPSGPPEITARQREVARLIEAGYTNERIADELGISVAGAKYHVSELLARLDLSRREEIAQWYRSGQRSRSRTWFGLTAGAVARGAAVAAGALLAAAGVVLMAFAARETTPPADPTPVGSTSVSTATEEPQDPERDAARQELLAIAGVADVVEAVEAGDVDRLMRLFARRSAPCFTDGSQRSGPCVGDGCLRARHDLCSLVGAAEGTPIETILMSRSAPHQADDFIFPGSLNLAVGNRWLEDELRPVLTSMIGRSGGVLEFADARRFTVIEENGDIRTEEWYRLGFATEEIDLSPLGAFNDPEVPSDTLGFFVLAGAATPIDRLVFLGPVMGSESRPHLPIAPNRFALDPPPDELSLERPEVTATRSQLAAIPTLQQVLAAAESGDVDALVVLMELTERVCFPDSVRHDFEACVQGTGATPDGVYWTTGSDTGLADGNVPISRVEKGAERSRHPRSNATRLCGRGRRRALLPRVRCVAGSASP